MITPNEHNSIRDSVLGTIRSGKTHMKPRWHFILSASLVAISVFITSIGIIYLASLIPFLLRQNGAYFAPDLGMRGFGLLFFSLPWILIVSALFFLIILEILVRKYAFAYKQPLMYSIIGIIALATLATFAVAQTGMHSAMYRAVKEGQLPIGSPLYGPFPLPENTEVHPGVITEVMEDGSFVMEQVDGTSLSIMMTDETHTPSLYAPKTDDTIVVFGESKDAQVSAWKIRPVEKKEFIPFCEGCKRNKGGEERRNAIEKSKKEHAPGIPPECADNDEATPCLSDDEI